VKKLVVFTIISLLLIVGCTRTSTGGQQNQTSNETIQDNSSYTELSQGNEFYNELEEIENDLQEILSEDFLLNLSDMDFDISFS
jgi:peptidoglycan hydrolase CwlO-like protein